jgi:ATP-dependent Clp protease ATP-binding subunit ClpX
MNTSDEKAITPKEIEQEMAQLLSKKFGDSVRIVSPVAAPQNLEADSAGITAQPSPVDFDLKPEDLVAFLDQYIVKQDLAKTVLATKICTHFNRIKHMAGSPDEFGDMVGSIKNNVLMLGPTGVGKTYMIRLIAKKIGVPMVKGDATKFSETGYVGGDVEDLVRDLVREADGDIERAQFGIIYIDEIDKIASSRNAIGADVSRTGVQRALLKPLEETDVDLKVPHDPISMIQEIERFRKTGKREKATVNTRHILFIVSGAFSELIEIIQKRVSEQSIGFGASVTKPTHDTRLLRHLKSEDLIQYGFESEFVGRLPVRAVFETLNHEDLFAILKSPNNPIVLGKKLDFAAYGIAIKFSDEALRLLAGRAFEEHTGARGLVSAVEQALLLFERRLPSTDIQQFPVTEAVIKTPDEVLARWLASPRDPERAVDFERIARAEIAYVQDYIRTNSRTLTDKHNLTLTESRIALAAAHYAGRLQDVGGVLRKIKTLIDETKNIELNFFKRHDINIVLEEEAIDFVIGQFLTAAITPDELGRKLSADFELGLKLVQEKSGKNRFFIPKQALLAPEEYLNTLIKNELRQVSGAQFERT